MIEYILSIAIILAVLIIYKIVIKPSRLHSRTVKDLKNMGYKVNALPFIPFRFSFLEIFHRDAKKSGDPFKFWKTVCPNYDISVGNYLEKVIIDISHPDFLKHYYSN